MPQNKKKRLLNSLVPLLRGMRGKPVIIELKNSTTIEGLVIQIDNFMKYVGIVHGRYFALQSIYSKCAQFRDGTCNCQTASKCTDFEFGYAHRTLNLDNKFDVTCDILIHSHVPDTRWCLVWLNGKF